MKKLLFASLLMLGPLAMYAQCDFDKDETDPYSKEHVRSVKHNFGNLRKMWVFILDQKGSKYYATVNMAEIGKFDNIASGILIKQANGNVLELAVESDVIPSVQIVGANINTQWLVKCVISEAKMKMLSESPIESIRVKMAGRDFDAPELKDKQSNKIMKSAGCMLEK